MAEFSIQDSAFTGFRLVREHPRFLATWAAMALVMSLAFTVVVLGLAGPAVMRLQSLGDMTGHDPAGTLRDLGAMLPAYALLTPVALVFYGVLNAAMNRAVLRPHDTKLAYVAFGKDELRQVGLLVLLFLVTLAVYLVTIIVVVLLGSVLGLATYIGPGVIVLITMVCLMGVLAFGAVRFSLASAQTFHTGRVNLMGSWALTRGRFWPIFGAYLLTFALAAVILFLTYLVILAAVAVSTGGNLFSLSTSPDTSSIGAYFTAAEVIQLVLSAGVSALIWPVLMTPPAAIYAHLMARGGQRSVGRATA